MTAIKKILIISFVICTTLFSFGQEDIIREEVDSLEYKPWQIKRMGKKADEANDIYSAIDYYKIFVELKPDKKRYQYLLAELYREARDYQNAMELYSKIFDEVPEQFPKAKYWAAIMKIMAEGDYNGATEELEEFKKEYKSILSQDKTLKKVFNAQLEGAAIAPKLIDEPLDVIINHLDTSINKAHTEFSPFTIGENKLVYGSLKQEGIKYYSTDPEAQLPTRKFYVAEREFDDWRATNEELDGPFNSDDFNVGNGTFSLDKKRFYFTRCEDNIMLEKVICSIYESHIDSMGNWTEPMMMEYDINDPEYTTTHPTVGIDPKTGAEALYFSTDREGGKGGMDIWYTYYNEKKGEWKAPKKSSSKINSAGDEITPYYDMDTKTLYFSSDGWPGMGGFDIFSTQGQLNKFLDPENIGYPINSNVDDLDFFIAPSQKEGFFISNRAGGVALKNETCCDDIYHFLYTKYLNIYVTGSLYEFEEKEKLDFKVLDSINQVTSEIIQFSDSTALDSAKVANAVKDTTPETAQQLMVSDAVITLFLVDDKSGEKIELKTDTTDEKGTFFMKLEQGNLYEIVFSKEGYFKHHEKVSTVDIAESDTIELKSMWLKKIPAQPIVVKNIYYPFDKSYLTDDSKIVIDTTLFTLLTDNPEIIIEVSSHTDSKGTDAYNERLSQARAQSVVDYLISKGINRKRLEAKGYGEAMPIAPNENEDGTDNEDGRAKNRRTEFRIIGIVEDATGVVYEE